MRKDLESREVRRRRWRHLLAQWKRSGLSQTAFCRRRRLPLANFAWWKSQLLGRAGPLRSTSAPAGSHEAASRAFSERVSSAFLPVPLRRAPSVEWACELEWPDGACLRWKDCPAPDMLSRLRVSVAAEAPQCG
jgi:hypothetical protein